MMELLTNFPAGVIAVTCSGQVTKRDYETVLVPAVETAFKQHNKLRLYYQIDPSFSGMDSGAMWQDTKIGVEHLLRWERIAVVTDVDWIRHTVHAFGFLIPGAVKTFPLEDAPKAREWIAAAEPQ